jgi:hypothetical protein
MKYILFICVGTAEIAPPHPIRFLSKQELAPIYKSIETKCTNSDEKHFTKTSSKQKYIAKRNMYNLGYDHMCNVNDYQDSF